jgi:U3 small nucleolar RNA-associated protein 23
MIMEPMADATVGNREREERSKFRDGLKSRGSGSLKRARDDGDEAEEEQGSIQNDISKMSKKRKGLKEPNPLSVKKPKKKQQGEDSKPAVSEAKEMDNGVGGLDHATSGGSDPNIKRKRKRKHKSAAGGGEIVNAVDIEE